MTQATLQCKLEGHTSDINCCAWSPITWSTLTSCSGDRTLRVWDISSEPPKTLSVVPASKYYVNACAYNPSGDLLATASSGDEGIVKLWSTASWTVVGTFTPHNDSARWCTFSPDGNLLATASDDTNVCVFEVGSLKQLSTLTRNSERVNCCLFAPAGWLLVTGSSSGELMLFNVYSTELLKRQMGIHNMGVTALALDPTSLLTAEGGGAVGGAFQQFKIASAGNDSVVKLWTVKCNGNVPNSKSVSLSLDGSLEGHSAAVYSCSYHPTRRLLASGSADKSVLLWNLDTKEKVQKLMAHSRYVIHVSFSPNGNHLVSASNDKTISLWRMKSSGMEECDDEVVASSSNSNALAGMEQQSLLSDVSWSMSDVIGWLEFVTKRQSTVEQSHPDDLRAVERLAVAIQQVSAVADKHGAGTEDLKCPITCELMRDPVLAADGYSYERTAITAWFSKGRRTSPVTNLPLTNTLLLPNRALKTIIEKNKRQTGT
ncbi:WD repeat, SAM and U-box domain-containing protein 1-like isoform X2 [Halichondria panicea]|uniref:WD repeat, SAM and U-box domain-containing protein 1-like isoform X2 n=1 Tax=Halichondria panicea TaxID=6063 RepID=UPI00312B2E68